MNNVELVLPAGLLFPVAKLYGSLFWVWTGDGKRRLSDHLQYKRLSSNNQILHLLGTSYWSLPRRSSMCLRPAMWPCFPLWNEERVRISDFPCNYLIQNLHYFGESLIWFKSQLWLFGNDGIVIFFLRGPKSEFLAEGFFRLKRNTIFKALIWRFQAIDGNRSL